MLVRKLVETVTVFNIQWHASKTNLGWCAFLHILPVPRPYALVMSVIVFLRIALNTTFFLLSLSIVSSSSSGCWYWATSCPMLQKITTDGCCSPFTVCAVYEEAGLIGLDNKLLSWMYTHMHTQASSSCARSTCKCTRACASPSHDHVQSL